VDGYGWWLLLLGIGLGIGLAWIAMGRLLDEPEPRASDRHAEAAWISRTIESRGGLAPQPLVEEVLDLHEDWTLGSAAYREAVADRRHERP
jgi:hypothetical protein